MSVIFSSHRFRATRSEHARPPRAAPEDPSLLGQRLVAAGRLDPGNLAKAMVLQAREDARLGSILVANDMVAPHDLLAALSEQSGLAILRRQSGKPDIEASASLDMDDCLQIGFVPVKRRNGMPAIALSDPNQQQLVRRKLPPELSRTEFILVSRETLQRGLEICFRSRLAKRAEARTVPELSCRNWSSFRTIILLCGLMLGILMSAIFAPRETALVLTITGLVAIFAGSLLKASCLLTGRHERQTGPLPDKLPSVSVLVPLFREAEIASSLINRLSKIEYPAELLEICLVVEADDTTTLTALAEVHLPRNMRAIVVPRGELKTKPRAMNYALDFTRGTIIGIYDAEDAPAPDQLHDVARTFAAGGRNLACVQGVLSYYNWPRNWLSKCFFLEYAAWFRVMLPGLRRMGFAVPLGGTTLFFKRDILIELGGWDAHNVTEDADLGIRLARFGYFTEVIDTVTEEEANCRLWPWIRQRSRWLKGYAVTWAVHMRRPAQLLRDLGLKRFIGFQVLFLGTLASFFLAPAFWIMSLLLVSGLATPELLEISRDSYIAVSLSFVMAEMLNIALVWKAVDGLRERPSRLWSVTLPLYFSLASVATYKALLELCRKPFFWDKTEHGHLGGATKEPQLRSVLKLPRIDPQTRLKRNRQMLAQRF